VSYSLNKSATDSIVKVKAGLLAVWSMCMYVQTEVVTPTIAHTASVANNGWLDRCRIS